jgi:hypothetical protein
MGDEEDEEEDEDDEDFEREIVGGGEGKHIDMR